jgi:putative transposase
VIRDEQDFGTHLDYNHWNPIKHGYVNKPGDWPYSSHKDWVNEGVYEQGWGWVEEPPNIYGLNFE